MHILIISDGYPPMRTSCATQIYDLAQAFVEQNHQVSVIIPAHHQKKSVEVSSADGPTVYAVNCFKTKETSYFRRTFAELVNPFVIAWHLKRDQRFVDQTIDGIVWYSPSIFWGSLVRQLKVLLNSKSYLILRDIFPTWALDLGLLKSNLVYSFFKRIELYQYEQADCIGIQSPNNAPYFYSCYRHQYSKIEVLWNWVAKRESCACSIRISQTILRGKFNLVYAGNLGVAQDVEQFVDLAKYVRDREDIGFVFIGRGSKKSHLEQQFKRENLKNALFFDEIPPEELQDLYAQCDGGLISLDLRHSTHNIPGKFLGYLQSNLPVIGFVNPGNDLHDLVGEWQVGKLVINSSAENLEELIQYMDNSKKIIGRYDEMLRHFFMPSRAVDQIVSFFRKNSG